LTHFVFPDDVVIYTNSLAEHDAKLRAAFDRLRKYNVKLQRDKCESVEEFPTPKSSKHLESFLGLAGYY
jgi:hypothetical protein